MPGGAWVWFGLVSPVLWAVWALWPARAAVLMDLGAERQRVRLRLRFFGVQAAVEGCWGTQRGRGADGNPVPAVDSVWLHVRVLGFLRIRRRLWALDEGGRRERMAAWVRSLWCDLAAGDVRSLVGRLRARAQHVRAWAPLGRKLGGVLRRHLTVQRLHVHFAFGSGDAAMTGWLAGTLWSLGGLLLREMSGGARFTAPPVWRVEPVFHTRCLRLRLEGRLTMRQGWLTWMGVLALTDVLSRRTEKPQRAKRFDGIPARTGSGS